MPAVTMVAAWMSALTGVGPHMASGSQVKSGPCALLPQTARSRRNGMAAFDQPPWTASEPLPAMAWKRPSYCTVP